MSVYGRIVEKDGTKCEGGRELGGEGDLMMSTAGEEDQKRSAFDVGGTGWFLFSDKQRAAPAGSGVR